MYVGRNAWSHSGGGVVTRLSVLQHGIKLKHKSLGSGEWEILALTGKGW